MHVRGILSTVAHRTANLTGGAKISILAFLLLTAFSWGGGFAAPHTQSYPSNAATGHNREITLTYSPASSSACGIKSGASFNVGIANTYTSTKNYGYNISKLPPESVVDSQVAQGWQSICSEPQFVAAVANGTAENFTFGLILDTINGTVNASFGESWGRNGMLIQEAWYLNVSDDQVSGPTWGVGPLNSTGSTIGNMPAQPIDDYILAFSAIAVGIVGIAVILARRRPGEPTTEDRLSP